MNLARCRGRLNRFRRVPPLFLIVLCANVATGGEQDTSHVNVGRLALAAGLTGGTIVAVHLYQQQAWWQGSRATFRFENDWSYALNIDKFGHAYGAYILSRGFSASLAWVGFSHAESAFWGPMLGLGYQLYVEVEDGFHAIYGFSPGDAFSDIGGAALPLAQEAFPVLRNFTLKWSYAPSRDYLNALKTDRARVFIDDYQGQIYWIAVDPHFLMGSHLAAAVPSWLGLALGAAVRTLDGEGNGERLFYLSLDYNLSKIQTGSSLLKAVFEALDIIHLPAPGIGLEGRVVRLGFFY